MRGVGLQTVKELLGHKDIKMTMRYSHLSMTYKQEAVNELGAIMKLGTRKKDAPMAVIRSCDVLENECRRGDSNPYVLADTGT